MADWFCKLVADHIEALMLELVGSIQREEHGESELAVLWRGPKNARTILPTCQCFKFIIFKAKRRKVYQSLSHVNGGRRTNMASQEIVLHRMRQLP